ncbi:MAG TPA: hypothetical protein VGJ26_09970, partial [Pirellulales bacterium]
MSDETIQHISMADKLAQPLIPLIPAIFAAFIFWKLIKELKSGVGSQRGFTVRRDESPRMFAFHLATLFAIGLSWIFALI